MRNYFVVTARSTIEIEVVRELQPPRILVSYFYFRNRNLSEFINEIGYTPEIILDSGAYSAMTQRRNISPIDYMDYIDQNREYISHYISLDVIGRPDTSKRYYTLMRDEGYSPIPVYHYGSDISFLDHYVAEGEGYIALGNTVPEKDKVKVAQWVNYLICKYPEVKFHLLGSSSKEIHGIKGLQSADSSSWIMMAINGFPASIKGKSRQAKKERAEHNMRHEMKRKIKHIEVQMLLFA